MSVRLHLGIQSEKKIRKTHPYLGIITNRSKKKPAVQQQGEVMMSGSMSNDNLARGCGSLRNIHGITLLLIVGGEVFSGMAIAVERAALDSAVVEDAAGH